MVAVPDAANRPFFAPRPDVEAEDAVSAAEDAVSEIAEAGVVSVIEEGAALTAEAGEDLREGIDLPKSMRRTRDLFCLRAIKRRVQFQA